MRRVTLAKAIAIGAIVIPAGTQILVDQARIGELIRAGAIIGEIHETQMMVPDEIRGGACGLN